MRTTLVNVDLFLFISPSFRRYLTLAESLPTYGVHYYPVKVAGRQTIKAAAVNMLLRPSHVSYLSFIAPCLNL